MIGVRSYAEKAIDAVERNRGAVDRARRMLRQHDGAQPAGDDADALFVWRRERRDIEDRIGAAEEALVFAEKAAETARAQAAERAAAGAHAAEERQAMADQKLVREVDALAAKLAAKLTELEASRARTKAVNDARGDRPYLLDAETRVRRQRREGVPAIAERGKAWFDKDGNRFGDNRKWDAVSMKYVECPDRTLREVIDVVREVQEPWFEMPTRLADEIRLVSVSGAQIWPPR